MIVTSFTLHACKWLFISWPPQGEILLLSTSFCGLPGLLGLKRSQICDACWHDNAIFHVYMMMFNKYYLHHSIIFLLITITWQNYTPFMSIGTEHSWNILADGLNRILWSTSNDISILCLEAFEMDRHKPFYTSRVAGKTLNQILLIHLKKHPALW